MALRRLRRLLGFGTLGLSGLERLLRRGHLSVEFCLSRARPLKLLVKVDEIRGSCVCDARPQHAQALFREGDAWAVYVVDAGRAKSRPVVVARRGARDVQITSGLSAGDRVIVHPDERVKDGIRVRLADGTERSRR